MSRPTTPLKRMAGTTGLEPAASAVTGQRSNQLNYVPTRQINEMRNRQCLCGFARFAYIALFAAACLKERSYWLNRLQTAYKFHRRSSPFLQKPPNWTSQFSQCNSHKYLNSFAQNAKGRGLNIQINAPTGEFRGRGLSAEKLYELRLDFFRPLLR